MSGCSILISARSFGARLQVRWTATCSGVWFSRVGFVCHAKYSCRGSLLNDAKDYLLKHNIAGPMRIKSFISKEGMVVLDAGRYA